jgi:3-deoxy-D-manno-octulosonate 8-phosphate phosphatase (KDO 8-P phosphatase)
VKTISDLPPGVRERLSRIRLLMMDVDGVLTNSQVFLDEHGVESKAFSTRDGFALVWMRQYGLSTGAISGRKSAATELRCKDLHFDEIHVGNVHKIPVIEEIIVRTDIPREAIAYIGDDVIDIPVMQRVGLSAAPQDAHSEVLKQVDLVLDRPGGNGAVRHFLDLWLMASGQWDTAMKDIYRGNY